MQAHRFFIDRLPHEGEVLLDGPDAHHLLSVLRLKPGDSFTACDGMENEALCKIVKIEGRVAVAQVLDFRRCDSETQTDIHLYPSLSKGERFEWTIQKAVELGVKSITPVLSKRCIASNPDEKKLIRWSRIAREAAQQSGGGVIPVINKAVSFNEAALNRSGTGVFCYEDEKKLLLGSFLKDKEIACVSVLTGPEGGYTEAEAEVAAGNGWTAVSLGRRILRCETAPVIAAAAILTIKGEI